MKQSRQFIRNVNLEHQINRIEYFVERNVNNSTDVSNSDFSSSPFHLNFNHFNNGSLFYSVNIPTKCELKRCRAIEYNYLSYDNINNGYLRYDNNNDDIEELECMFIYLF